MEQIENKIRGKIKDEMGRSFHSFRFKSIKSHFEKREREKVRDR